MDFQDRQLIQCVKRRTADGMKIIRRHREEHGELCACGFCSFVRDMPDFGSDGILTGKRKFDWMNAAMMKLGEHLRAVGAANGWTLTEGE